MIWDRTAIADAILSNERVDGAGQVLGRAPRVERRGFAAPIAKRAVEVLNEAEWASDHGYLSIGDFEQLSLRARRHVIDGLGAGESPFPVIPAKEIEAAIAKVADKIDFDQSGALAEQTDGSRTRLLSRRGLQITGCLIEGDLVLVNARLPFSVRLIGCVIDGAVVVDHCGLTTLDLSGSVVRGVHASFLNAAGSLRLRRTVSTGPIDLGGAKITGLVDLSDAIVLPFDAPPSTEAFSGDRGAVNLSLASLENEFVCNRARIYGGLNLRGAAINRSVFMEQAQLFSPVGALERMLGEIVLLGANKSKVPPHVSEASSQDELLARQTRSVDAPTGEGPDIDAETMRPLLRSGNLGPVFSRLIKESVRSRTAALRADGVRIEGSVFARRLRAAGRIRLKYAQIGGGLHLNGSKLRAIQHIDAQLHASRIRSYPRHRTAGRKLFAGLTHLVDPGDTRAAELVALRPAVPRDEHVIGERTQDALDLRASTIGGQLELQVHLGDGAPVFSEVHGVVALTGARIGGDIEMRDVWFCQRVCEPLEQAPVSSVRSSTATELGQFSEPALHLSRAEIGGSINLQRSDGLYGVLALRLAVRATSSWRTVSRRIPSPAHGTTRSRTARSGYPESWTSPAR